MSALSTFHLFSRICLVNSGSLDLFRGISHSFSQVSAIRMLSVDYEVFGKVQGVFFRKYTQQKAKDLGLTGWVKNTVRGTVVGQFEGENAEVSEMKHWLQNVGSPHSKIDKCEFKNEKEISKSNFKKFVIKD